MALIEIKKVPKIVTSHGLGTQEDPCRHVTDFVDPDTMETIATFDSCAKLEVPSE